MCVVKAERYKVPVSGQFGASDWGTLIRTRLFFYDFLRLILILFVEILDEKSFLQTYLTKFFIHRERFLTFRKKIIFIGNDFRLLGKFLFIGIPDE